jgi:hypothetical protein
MSKSGHQLRRLRVTLATSLHKRRLQHTGLDREAAATGQGILKRKEHKLVCMDYLGAAETLNRRLASALQHTIKTLMVRS